MKYIFTFLIIFSGLFSYSQNIELITEKFNSFSDSSVFDFVYVHSDKDEYNVNQNIWFTAYVVDLKNNKPDTLKQILYVELISFEKKIVYTKKYFVNNNGLCSGNIFIPDSLSQGFYQLRAYTNSMRNYSSQLFFTKSIFINNDLIEYSRNYYRQYRKKNKTSVFVDFNLNNNKLINNQPYSLYFYPNFYSTINTSTKLLLLDNDNNIIYEQKKIIPGKIYFIPEINKKYYLILYLNKKKRKYILDNVIDDGLTASVKEKKDFFELKLLKRQFITNDEIAKTYMIIAEKAGKIYFETKILLNSEDSLKIPKNVLPKGISFVHILNSRFHELKEIPVYKKDTTEPVKINSYVIEDSLVIEILNTNNIEANVSVSVTNSINKSPNLKNYFNFFAFSIFPDMITDSIISTSYLIACFKNLYIKNIYSFDSIISQKKDYYTNKPKKNIELKGFVNLILEKIPSKNSPIRITILNSYNDRYSTLTNNYGKFCFDSLNYPDSVEYYIQAKSAKDKDYVGITVFNYDTNIIYFEPELFLKNEYLTRKYIKRDTTNYKKTSKSLYGLHPDQIISGEDLVNSGSDNLLDALKGRVTGYSKTGNLVTFRGPKTIDGNQEPLYLIDDVPVDVDAIIAMNLHDIDRVEIIRSAYGGAIYGMYAYNGIIAVYTKKGYKIQWGETLGKIPGISATDKFIEKEDETMNHTFYWNPNFNIKTDENLKIIKIKINPKNKININIQGVSNNCNFISYKNVIL